MEGVFVGASTLGSHFASTFGGNRVADEEYCFEGEYGCWAVGRIICLLVLLTNLVRHRKKTRNDVDCEDLTGFNSILILRWLHQCATNPR